MDLSGVYVIHTISYFLDHQVYWRFPDTEWYEETDFEDSSGQFHRGFFKGHHGPELTVGNFWHFLKQYTGRELSYEEDVLKAFSGILKAIPDEFSWGLPCSAFGKCLAWGVAEPDQEGSLASRRRFEGCPSWSSMAWKWSSRLSCWPISRYRQSLISAYCFRHSGL